MWTDGELDAAEQREYYASGGTVTGMAELYRLARLGLAAEQVGKAVFSRMAHFSFDNHEHLDPFLHHEAWRK